jgi:hypothetical protein
MSHLGNRRIMYQHALLGGGAGGGGGGALTFTWTDSKILTGTPAPPASFAAASIGAASSDRIVVAGISWQGTASTNMDITAVTIGGVTATQVAYNRSSARAHGIWYAAVPTGTTAVVSVTYVNGWVDSLVLNVGTITGSATTSAPGGTGITAGAYPAGSTNVSVTVPANGVTVIDSYADVTAAPVTTWTGTFSSSADKDEWVGIVGGSMTHLTASSATANLTAVTNCNGTWGWVGANFSP